MKIGIGAFNCCKRANQTPEAIKDGVLVSGLFKNLLIFFQSPLSVLFIHEGQQSSELGKKLLFVNGASPPLFDTAYKGDYIRSGPFGQEVFAK